MQRQRYLMIAVTGLVAMIAQMVWYRYASEVLGQSALTVAAVVASALAGLAIGNRWGGKSARLSASQCVAGMGLAVLLGQAFFSSLPAIEPLLEATPFGWTIAVVAPLWVINFFAGAVFPRLLVQESNSQVVGGLSAAETAGGCVGAIFTGCFAMQNFGLMPTLIGGGVAALAVSVMGKNEVADAAKRALKPDIQSAPIGLHILTAVCISGVASLGMEVVWQRLLILIVGTDTFSYAIVVTSYLLGFAVGASISSLWLRMRAGVLPEDRLQTVAMLQILTAITSLIVLSAVIYLASGLGQAWTGASLLGYDVPLLKRLLLCGGLLIVPTALQGALFPLVVDAVADNRSHLASPAGKIYAAVATGNVFGVLLCGFFLIPMFGLQISAAILAVVFTIAAWLFNPKKISNVLFGLTVLMFAMCGHRLLFKEPIGLAINPEQTSKFYYREGPAHTVSVLADKSNLHHRRMTVDGIVIGQSGKNAEEKQLMLAHLPALLNYQSHPIENVAVIGLGSGLLSGEVAAIEGVKSVNTIELSPAVIEASACFTDLWPANPVAQTKVTQADGIFWLSKRHADAKPLDAIISDGKSRPGHVGNAAFFSSDYYRRAVNRLSPHGKFVQWYSLDGAVSETKVVLKTFAQTFPHAVVAIAAPDSIYLVGSPQPIEMEAGNAESYLRLETSRSLMDYHWRSVDDLRSMVWLRISSEIPLLKDCGTNSLSRPILEQFSFDTRTDTLTKNKIENLQLLKSLTNHRETSFGLFADDRGSDSTIVAAATNLIDASISVVKRQRGWLDRAAAEMKPAFKSLPQLHRGAFLANSYLVASRLAASKNDAPGEISMLKRAGSLSLPDDELQLKIGQRLLYLGDADSALPHFLNVIASQEDSGPANKGAAIALIKMQKRASAFPYFQKAIADPDVRLDTDFLAMEKLFKTSQPLQESDQGQDLIDSMKTLLRESSREK